MRLGGLRFPRRGLAPSFFPPSPLWGDGFGVRGTRAVIPVGLGGRLLLFRLGPGGVGGVHGAEPLDEGLEVGLGRRRPAVPQQDVGRLGRQLGQHLLHLDRVGLGLLGQLPLLDLQAVGVHRLGRLAQHVLQEEFDGGEVAGLGLDQQAEGDLPHLVLIDHLQQDFA